MMYFETTRSSRALRALLGCGMIVAAQLGCGDASTLASSDSAQRRCCDDTAETHGCNKHCEPDLGVAGGDGAGDVPDAASAPGEAMDPGSLPDDMMGELPDEVPGESPEALPDAAVGIDAALAVDAGGGLEVADASTDAATDVDPDTGLGTDPAVDPDQGVVALAATGRTICGTTSRDCVTVNDTQRYQTIVGWEATSQAGENMSGFNNYSAQLMDRAVNELGLNRMRLEVKSPSVGAPFDLTKMDANIVKVIKPLRAKLAARGEKLWVNVCVVGSQLKNDPAKYASEALRTVEHIKSTHGFVPDSWEVALEPDVFGWNDPMLVGNALVAAGKLLASKGYNLDFVAPSTTKASRVVSYVDKMATIPGIFTYWREMSYHRYDYPDVTVLQAIRAKAKTYKLRTSMLEHLKADTTELHNDLIEGNVSGWQQFALAFPASTDDGNQYYWPSNGGNTLALGAKARYLRQYFAYLRNGTVRVGSSTALNKVKASAYLTPASKPIVVISAASVASVDVAGLPAGTYGVTYTTAADTHKAAPNITVAAGQVFTAKIPAAGTMTVFMK